MYKIDIMDIYEYIRVDFNPIGVEIGDQVCLGPVKKFMAVHYAGFMVNYGGNVGPFEVINSFPDINVTEIMVGSVRVVISNDMIKKFCWN